MKLKIETLAELLAQGKKVAYSVDNRKLNKNNLKAKAKSLKDTNGNIIPLMYVSAKKALDEGLTLVDANTSEQVTYENCEQYIVLVDGQHRFASAMNNGIDAENIYLFEAYLDLPTLKLLSIANIDTNKWNGGDFAHGAAMAHPEDEGLSLIRSLTDSGYPLNTASLMATFTANVTSSKLAKIMSDPAATVQVNEARCNRYIKTAEKKFADNLNYLKKRYLIQAVVELSANCEGGYGSVLDALEKLTSNEVAQILATKGDNKELCEQFLKNHLAA